MTLRLNKQVMALALCFAHSTSSFAQQVLNTTVGAPAKFEIESKVLRADMKECGIVVTQPNGSNEVLILQQPNFKTELSYTPNMQGTSVVSWKGEYIVNGKVDNQIAGGVKQIFSNIGELVTLSKLTQGSMPCPGSGTITIIATPNIQPTTTIAATAGLQPTTTSKLLVTAELPSSFNPPIDQDKLKIITASNPEFGTAVQGYTMKKAESLTLIMMQAKQGEPYAQFFYGLAHTETWTNLYNKKQACYWFKQSAAAGVSQARLFLAIKAFKDKECFDVPPTLDQAKVWAQLASMSSDVLVKEDAGKLLQEILKFQIETGGK
jgi:hypothetical protein